MSKNASAFGRHVDRRDDLETALGIAGSRESDGDRVKRARMIKSVFCVLGDAKGLFDHSVGRGVIAERRLKDRLFPPSCLPGKRGTYPRERLPRLLR